MRFESRQGQRVTPPDYCAGTGSPGAAFEGCAEHLGRRCRGVTAAMADRGPQQLATNRMKRCQGIRIRDEAAGLAIAGSSAAHQTVPHQCGHAGHTDDALSNLIDIYTVWSL